MMFMDRDYSYTCGEGNIHYWRVWSWSKWAEATISAYRSPQQTLFYNVAVSEIWDTREHIGRIIFRPRAGHDSRNIFGEQREGGNEKRRQKSRRRNSREEAPFVSQNRNAILKLISKETFVVIIRLIAVRVQSSDVLVRIVLRWSSAWVI